MNIKIIPTIVVLCATPHLATAQSITPGSSPSILVKSEVARTVDNPLQLGFNTPWNSFQGNNQLITTLWNSTTRTVSPELVEFLKRDFKGATYRYQGGSLFEWTRAVGPVANRQQMKWYSMDSSASAFPYFGVDEYLAFVKQVNGVPLIQLNVITNDGGWVASQSDWIERKKRDLGFFEYVNAPVNEDWNGDGTYQGQLRAANNGGNTTPYGVKIWELGNETDTNQASHGYTADLYASRCAELMAIMRSTPGGDKLILVPHGRTQPWEYTNPANPWPNDHYSVWNTAVMNILNPGSPTPADGLAIHPYYRGISVGWAGDFVNIFHTQPASHPNVYITEHAVWVNGGTNQWTWGRTTDLTSAVDVTDFVLRQAQKPFVKLALNHELASVGPWQPFNIVEPAGNYSTSTVFTPRPLAYALRIVHKSLDQAVIQKTDVVTPFTFVHSNGGVDYDISATGFNYSGTPIYGALWSSKATVPRDAALTFPNWGSGNKILRLEGLGGAGMGQVPWQVYQSCTVAASSGPVRLPDQSMGAVTVIGEDLVVNSSYETSAGGWESRNQSTTGTIARVANDPVGAFSGTGFLRVTKTSGTGTHVAVQPNWHNANLGNSGPLRANPHDAYVLRANVRTTNCAANSVSLKVQMFQQAGGVQSKVSPASLGGTAGWKPLALEFIPSTVMQNPAGLMTNAELMLQISSTTGYADFDSVTLQRRPNTLTNGALQTGTTAPNSWSIRGGMGTHQRSIQPYYTTLGAASAANPLQFVQDIAQPTLFTARRSEMWRLRAKVRHTNLDATGATLKIQLFSNTEFLGALTSSTAKVTGSSTGWVDVLFEFCPRDFSRVNEIKRIEPMVQMGSATGSIDICAVNLEILD